MTTRRKVILGSFVAAILPAGNILSQVRELPELEPVHAAKYTEIPDAGILPSYEAVDIPQVLRQTPSDLEGLGFIVRGTIRHRWVAEDGYGYPVGYEGDVFRSLIWVTLDGDQDAFLAANDDLSTIEDLRTFAAIGVYGGIYEFILNTYNLYEVPLILVSEIGSPKAI